MFTVDSRIPRWPTRTKGSAKALPVVCRPRVLACHYSFASRQRWREAIPSKARFFCDHINEGD
jgi:hypothetical protein